MNGAEVYIQFCPPLSDQHQSAITDLEIGERLQVALDFPHDFWGVKSQFIGALTEAPSFPLYVNHQAIHGVPRLTAIAGDGFAKTMQSAHDNEVVEAEVVAIVPAPDSIEGEDKVTTPKDGPEEEDKVTRDLDYTM